MGRLQLLPQGPKSQSHPGDLNEKTDTNYDKPSLHVAAALELIFETLSTQSS